MASDAFGEVIKFGLIAVVGYFAYEYFFAAPATAAPAAGGGGGTPSGTAGGGASTGGGSTAGSTYTGTATYSGSGSPTTDSLTVQQSKVAAAAGASAGSSQTASVWNWYYNVAYNLPQTTTWFLGDDGSPMSLGAYMTLRQTKGFSGLGAGLLPRPVPPGSVPPGLHRGWTMGRRTRGYTPVATPMVAPMNYVRRGAW